ncbi:hypothetical protein B0H14DRAFT_638648 [Mycena olivaceomarginata]|nr:hypothetical protein B0H14DRAFT_638648 [Mycena olivaceomarginata]
MPTLSKRQGHDGTLHPFSSLIAKTDCLNQCLADYWLNLTGKSWYNSTRPAYTEWISMSTGHLSAELDHESEGALISSGSSVPSNTKSLPCPIPLHAVSSEDLFSLFELEDIFLPLCYRHWSFKEVSLHRGYITLGALFSVEDMDDPFSSMSELLHFPTAMDLYRMPGSGWGYIDEFGAEIYDFKSRHMTADGWMRINLDGLRDLEPHKSGACEVHHFRWEGILECSRDIQKWWLTQANHFSSEKSASSYLLATGIQFRVSLWDSPDEISLRGTFMADAPMQEIYLFLFDPCVHIQNGRTSVKIPATSHAYYWSFQHDGSNRLSDEMLEEIVPPQVLFEARIVGHTWSDVDYELIREFSLAKGFNPNSNDVAIELGYPLAALHDEPIQISLQADSHEPHLDDFPRPSGVCYYCEKVEQLAYQIWRHQSSCDCDENIQQRSCKNPGIDQVPEHSDAPEDMLVPQTFKFFINIQLTLILFHTLSWLYDQVSEGMRFK